MSVKASPQGEAFFNNYTTRRGNSRIARLKKAQLQIVHPPQSAAQTQGFPEAASQRKNIMIYKKQHQSAADAVPIYLIRVFSEQPGNHSVPVNVNSIGCGGFRQSRHGHYVSGQRHDESGSGGERKAPHGYAEFLRSAEQSGIV